MDRRAMDVQVILIIVAALFSTQADKCMEDQQCSNCSSTTQYCDTDCFSGYFGLRCTSLCSHQCINSTCRQTLRGTYTCSKGCVPGFYGSRCNIPCTRAKGNCTKCPQGCDRTFCHLTSSCVAGCHDQYYGSNCKSCSPRCRQCNRITGRCDVCHDPYHGLDCEYSCEHCSTTDCVQTCAPGLYGRTCSLTCHRDCLSYPTTITNVTLTKNTHLLCISECQRYSGVCINGCVDDGSGPHCSSPIKCNPNCLGCNETGTCVEGCLSGYYGDDCKPCPRTCFNHTCYPNNGSCDNGCIQGQYGETCHLPCLKCPGGACHSTTGICIQGCLSGYYGDDCKPCLRTCFNRTCYPNNGSCDNGCIQGQYGETCHLPCLNCPGGACHSTTGKCAPVQSAMTVATIGTTTALLVLVFGIILRGCLFHFRRVSAKREESHQRAVIPPQSDTTRQDNSSRRCRDSENIYSDVNEDEMGPVIVFL